MATKPTETEKPDAPATASTEDKKAAAPAGPVLEKIDMSKGLLNAVQTAAIDAGRKGMNGEHAVLVGLENALATVHNYVNGIGEHSNAVVQELLKKAKDAL